MSEVIVGLLMCVEIGKLFSDLMNNFRQLSVLLFFTFTLLLSGWSQTSPESVGAYTDPLEFGKEFISVCNVNHDRQKPAPPTNGVITQ